MEKGNVFMVLLVALLIFLAVVLATAVVGNSGTSMRGNWTLTLNALSGGTSYAQQFVTDDNYLYAAGGKTIYCLGPQGIMWSATPHDPSTIMSSFDRWNVAGGASDSGRSYLLVAPGSADISGFQFELMAILDNGQLLWTRSLVSFPRSTVMAGGGNVYIYNAGNVTALDKEGDVLWKLEDIGYIPSVDSAGRLYVLRGGITGSPLEAYFPNGTLIWRLDLPDSVDGSPMNDLAKDPFYQNGTLYLWLNYGLAALDANGTLKWAKHYDDQSVSAASGYVPDAYGNIYIDHFNYNTDNSDDYIREIDGSYHYIHNSSKDTLNNYVTAIGPDGSENIVLEGPGLRSLPSGIVDGVTYEIKGNAETGGTSPDTFPPASIAARDLRTQQLIWNFTLPASGARTAILNESNVWNLMPNNATYAMEVNKLTPAAWYTKQGLQEGTTDIQGLSWITMYHGKDVLYVYYWAYNCEFPPFFDRANITYTGGLFVLDKDGRLLWSRQTDSYITGLAEKNGTVIYMTHDGKFSAVGADVAAGLIAAVAYLLIRVFALGTVSRARSQLETNENRNRILELIAGRPGSTLHEIARDTSLNIGTVRYHMLILSMNHKITVHHDSTKFVRYFRNAHAYSDDEKRVIGLMRREPVRKLLSAMAGHEAMTNQEISAASGMQESSVSKYLRELISGGIIARSPAYNEKPVYSVDSRYRQTIRDLSESISFAGGKIPDEPAIAAIDCDMPVEPTFQRNQ
ncbi:MAG: PQQ-binding-like beta-propeller repeat protein [Methanocella sp.]